MKSQNILFEDKLLAALSYAFFAPSIYIILSYKRRQKEIAVHAAQAFVLWICFAMIYFTVRVFYLFISSFLYFPFYGYAMELLHFSMWCYALYCGYLVLSEKDVLIPFVSSSAYKLL